MELQPWPIPETVKTVGRSLFWQPPPPIDVTKAFQIAVADLDGPWMDEFLALADGSTEQIRAFASRRGVLGLCRHSLPYTHSFAGASVPGLAIQALGVSRIPAVNSGRAMGSTCHPWGQNLERPRESSDRWRDIARRITSVLKIASRLQASGLGNATHGDPDDWRTLFGDDPWEGQPVTKSSLAFVRANLSMILDGWVQMAGLRPYFWWAEGSPELSMRPNSLFGGIIMNAILAVARVDGLAICDACRRVYIPPARPRKDRKNYCNRPSCGERRASRRAASRRFREKDRGRRAEPSPTASTRSNT